MNLTGLREIGLTDSETKVYLGLLHLGESTRGDIVAESGVSGSKIYDLLERLQEKGLVSVHVQDNVKHFKAMHPNQIIRYLDDRQERIEETKHTIEGILPSLVHMYQSSKEDQQTELFFGLKGLESFFMEQVDTCAKGETCYVIGGTSGDNEEVLVSFFQKIQRLRKEKGLVTKMLYNKRQQEIVRMAYQQNAPEVHVRYLDHASPVAINFYKDCTGIIVFGRKIVLVKIRSQSVAQSFKEYFELLWKTAV